MRPQSPTGAAPVYAPDEDQALRLTARLMDQGLLPKDCVVDGKLMIIPSRRRLQHYRVRGLTGAPNLFIKQADRHRAADCAALEREAACYWLMHSEPGYSEARAQMPAYHQYDPEYHRLVVEDVVDGPALFTQLQDDDADPAALAACYAEALARVHQNTADLAGSDVSAAVSHDPPWILRFYEYPDLSFLPAAAGMDYIADLIYRHPVLQRGLHAARALWQRRCLIHGDAKFDNCLIRTPAPAGAGPQAVLIDWELGGLGDPWWDVATVLQEFLTAAVMAPPVDPPVYPPAHPPAQAQKTSNLSAIQPMTRRFFQTYQGASAAATPARADRPTTIALYSGARLLQSAIEHTAQRGAVDAQVMRLLRIAQNVFRRPQQAAHELYGID